MGYQRHIRILHGVIDGPYEAGTVIETRQELWRVTRKSWQVKIDMGDVALVAESLLLPEDDGEQNAEPREEQLHLDL